MAPRRVAKPALDKPISRHVAALLGVLSLLFSIYTGLSAGTKDGAELKGEILTFKTAQERLNDANRDAHQRIWDALNEHKDKSEDQHLQLRREIEADMRREIDNALRVKK